MDLKVTNERVALAVFRGELDLIKIMAQTDRHLIGNDDADSFYSQTVTDMCDAVNDEPRKKDIERARRIAKGFLEHLDAVEHAVHGEVA